MHECASEQVYVEFEVWRNFMWKRVTLACIVFCFVLSGCQKKAVTETRISAEEASRKNPIDANPASIAEGQRLYHATDCALCHGKDGEGKGVLAKDVSMNTHDWRRPASLEHFTDGELFYIVTNGVRFTGMPAWDMPDDQIWRLVALMRHLPKQ